MVKFNLWIEGFIFVGVFSVIIIVPCVLVALMGVKMIHQLGQYPTRTPVVQMSILFKLVMIEAVTFLCLSGFYFFSIE